MGSFDGPFPERRASGVRKQTRASRLLSSPPLPPAPPRSLPLIAPSLLSSSLLHTCTFRYDNFYSVDDPSGKIGCKLHLQSSMGLQENKDIPIIAFIGRLAHQKGVDVLCSVLDWLMTENSGVTGQVQLVRVLACVRMFVCVDAYVVRLQRDSCTYVHVHRCSWCAWGQGPTSTPTFCAIQREDTTAKFARI